MSAKEELEKLAEFHAHGIVYNKTNDTAHVRKGSFKAGYLAALSGDAVGELVNCWSDIPRLKIMGANIETIYSDRNIRIDKFMAAVESFEKFKSELSKPSSAEGG